MARSRIRLLAAVVAGIVVLVAVGTHFLLPPYLEGRVEDRLEEHGGHADVELSAVPAIRLLAGHGDRLEITGSGLEVDEGKRRRDTGEDGVVVGFLLLGVQLAGEGIQIRENRPDRI